MGRILFFECGKEMRYVQYDGSRKTNNVLVPIRQQTAMILEELIAICKTAISSLLDGLNHQERGNGEQKYWHKRSIIKHLSTNHNSLGAS